MPGNQARILFREDDLSTEWFRFRNINKWIQKLWGPSIIGMYVGKYEGEWQDGQMHGAGTLKISRIFRGYLSLGLVSFGWKLIDQGKYVGEWKNGKEHGKGRRFYRAGLMNYDKGKYEGEWKNGLEHGHGTRTWPGEWKNVEKYGKGIGIYWDAGKYEGEWKNGLEHGHGTKTWPDGKKFIGKWKNGEYFHGTYYFDNGDKHFGFFKDGVAKGHGIRTYFDGRKHTGEFKYREERSEGTCILTGEKTVSRFIESIPTGFDTNKNYIGCQTVKYKEEKRASFISYFFHD